MYSDHGELKVVGGVVVPAASMLLLLLMALVVVVVLAIVSCAFWKRKQFSVENFGLPGRIKSRRQEDATAASSQLPIYQNQDDIRMCTMNRELPQIPTGSSSGGGGATAWWQQQQRDSAAISDQTSQLYAVVAEHQTTATQPPAAGTLAAAAVLPEETAAGGEDDEVDQMYQQPTSVRWRHERSNLQSAGGSSSSASAAAHSRNPSRDMDVEIPARLAVSGGVPASVELPYMTPPVQGAGLYFSGDSVHSADSRGYTRISVREPAAELRLRQQPSGPAAATDPGHGSAAGASSRAAAAAASQADNFYSTVDGGSDDELYEAIPDRRRAARRPNSGTQPTQHGTTQAVTAAGDVMEGATVSAAGGNSVPPPPSVNSLKHAAHSSRQPHSRQASSSSVASSCTSPASDRRPARSPLPPLPSADSPALSADQLELMYARVQKPPRPQPQLVAVEADGVQLRHAPPPPPPHAPAAAAVSHRPLAVNYSDFEVVRDASAGATAVSPRSSSIAHSDTPIADEGRGPLPADTDPNYECIGSSAAVQLRLHPEADEEEGLSGGGYARIASRGRHDEEENLSGGGYARIASRPASMPPRAGPSAGRQHLYERVRSGRRTEPPYERIASGGAVEPANPGVPHRAAGRFSASHQLLGAAGELLYETVRSEAGSDTDDLYSRIADPPYASIQRADALHHPAQRPTSQHLPAQRPAPQHQNQHGLQHPIQHSEAATVDVSQLYAKVRKPRAGGANSGRVEKDTAPPPISGHADSVDDGGAPMLPLNGMRDVVEEHVMYF